jgi:hypothetical protein
MQEFIGHLKKLAQQGRIRHQANNEFLAELDELIRNYDWPWRMLLFQEDFEDGNFTSNPKWVAAPGNFWVDSDRRLHTRFTAPEKKPKSAPANDQQDATAKIFGAILSEVLKQKRPEEPSKPKPDSAEITTAIPISNAFYMEMEFTMIPTEPGRGFDIEFFQGTQRDRSYRLAYIQGQKVAFELKRRVYGAQTVLSKSDKAASVDDGGTHTVVWRRYGDGNMMVTVDGILLLRAFDMEVGAPFDGVNLINKGGHYAISRIKIYGTGTGPG